MHLEVRFKSMAPVVTISQLSEATGKAASALRYYEREGFLKPIGRSGGKRVYAADAVQQVALVDFLQVCGLTISEIRELIDARGRIAPQWRERMSAKVDELVERRRQIDLAIELLEHSIGCPEVRLDACPVFREGMRHHAQQLAGRAAAGA